MKKLTAGRCAELYALLREAKLTKLPTDDKLHVVDILHALRPVATKLEDARRDCIQSLKPEKFEERLEAARDYEKGNTPPAMTREEYDVFIRELTEYNNLVADGIRAFSEKEAEVPTLSTPAFRSLLAVNEWTAGQVETLTELVC